MHTVHGFATWYVGDPAPTTQNRPRPAPRCNRGAPPDGLTCATIAGQEGRRGTDIAMPLPLGQTQYLSEEEAFEASVSAAHEFGGSPPHQTQRPSSPLGQKHLTMVLLHLLTFFLSVLAP